MSRRHFVVEETRKRRRRWRVIFAFTRPSDGSRMCFYGRRGNRRVRVAISSVKIRARARGSPIDLVRARRSFRRKTLERVKRKGKLPFASLPELSRSLHACMCALQPAERERNRKFISRNHPTSNSPLKITLHFALLVSHSRASPLALYSVSHFACNALVTHHVLDVAPA